MIPYFFKKILAGDINSLNLLVIYAITGFTSQCCLCRTKRGTEERFSNDVARSHHILQSCITMIMAQPRRYMTFPQRKSLSSPVTYKSLMA